MDALVGTAWLARELGLDRPAAGRDARPGRDAPRRRRQVVPRSRPPGPRRLAGGPHPRRRLPRRRRGPLGAGRRSRAPGGPPPLAVRGAGRPRDGGGRHRPGGARRRLRRRRRARWRRGSGTCSVPTATTTWPSSTEASRSGRRKDDRSRPARRASPPSPSPVGCAPGFVVDKAGRDRRAPPPARPRRAGGRALPRRGGADRPAGRPRPGREERAVDGQRHARPARRSSCRPPRSASATRPSAPAARSRSSTAAPGSTPATISSPCTWPGFAARLYAGSWSEWSLRSRRSPSPPGRSQRLRTARRGRGGGGAGARSRASGRRRRARRRAPPGASVAAFAHVEDVEGDGEAAAAEGEAAGEARVQRGRGSAGGRCRWPARRGRSWRADVGSPVLPTWKYGMGKPSRALTTRRGLEAPREAGEHRRPRHPAGVDEEVVAPEAARADHEPAVVLEGRGLERGRVLHRERRGRGSAPTSP